MTELTHDPRAPAEALPVAALVPRRDRPAVVPLEDTCPNCGRNEVVARSSPPATRHRRRSAPTASPSKTARSSASARSAATCSRCSATPPKPSSISLRKSPPSSSSTSATTRGTTTSRSARSRPGPGGPVLARLAAGLDPARPGARTTAAAADPGPGAARPAPAPSTTEGGPTP